MRSDATTPATVLPTGQLVGRATTWPDPVQIMARLKAWASGGGRFKPDVVFKETFGCDERTAQRWFAGDRSPDFLSTIGIIVHPETVTVLLEAATEHLSPDEYQRFWKAVGRASLRALVREENASG